MDLFITISLQQAVKEKEQLEARLGRAGKMEAIGTLAGGVAHDLNHIFEPFYIKKKMGRSGTGLGMAVVWGTVKDHLEYIDYESREGQGSRFTLFFPVTRKSPPEEMHHMAIEEYTGNGEMILVVDDVIEQKAIFASGFSETERIREVQRLGAAIYLKKPYTIEKIGAAVRSALRS